MQARFVPSALLALSVSVPSVLGCSPSDEKLPQLQRQVPSSPSSQVRSTAAMPAVDPPPALSGGTLLVQKDGTTAVAADPDRDVVWVVDLGQRSVLHQVALQPRDEPGRGVEDGAGRVHVALRRGGALVSIDPKAGSVLARRPVCPAPRGLAYDASADLIHVACADGRLVSLPAAGGDAVRTVQLDRDLRDVVVQGSKIYVSRFRTADILELAADGTLAQRITLPASQSQTHDTPSVAWRTVGLPGGGLAVLHQRAPTDAVSTMPGGYTTLPSNPCEGAGMIQDAVTIVTPGSAPSIAPSLSNTSLAVDLAVSPDGTMFAIAAPRAVPGDAVGLLPVAAILKPASSCVPPLSEPAALQTVAVAFDGLGRVVTQVRDPAAILIGGPEPVGIPLPGKALRDAGFDLFHTPTTTGFIACASCHPEAGDDGRVWNFVGTGPRRTQNLRGGVLARAPFHWDANLADMDALVNDVLVGRMGGDQPVEDAVVALGKWMDAQPALLPPPPADPAAAARGGALFHDPEVGCTGCHLGPQLSNHQLLDVGTGDYFKTPSLVSVAYRAPFLHNGCAARILDRFTNAVCGGGSNHGNTSQLDAGQLADLVAFLETL